MTRTQSDIGESLSALYDTQGQKLAGNADINDREISLVHELGGQAVAERLRSRIIELTHVAANQSSSFLGILAVPSRIMRILGFSVSVDTAARIANVSVGISHNNGTRSVFWFNWDSVTGTTRTARTPQAGGTNMNLLVPDAAASVINAHQQIGIRLQPAAIGAIDTDAEELFIAGTTLAFGAGTVLATCWLHVLQFDDASLPGRPVAPLPSW